MPRYPYGSNGPGVAHGGDDPNDGLDGPPPGGWYNLPNYEDQNSQASVDAHGDKGGGSTGVDDSGASGPSATMTGGAAPMAANGPQTGGSGGYGFTNLASYLFANPMGQGPGSGYAPTPTGFKQSDYNSQINGFAPTGEYTAGMSGVDNALNASYGRTGYPTQQAPASGGGSAPQGSGGGGNPENTGGSNGGANGGGGGGGGSSPWGPGGPLHINSTLRSGQQDPQQKAPYSNLRTLFSGGRAY